MKNSVIKVWFYKQHSWRFTRRNIFLWYIATFAAVLPLKMLCAASVAGDSCQMKVLPLSCAFPLRIFFFMIPLFCNLISGNTKISLKFQIRI